MLKCVALGVYVVGCRQRSNKGRVLQHTESVKSIDLIPVPCIIGTHLLNLNQSTARITKGSCLKEKEKIPTRKKESPPLARYGYLQ